MGTVQKLRPVTPAIVLNKLERPIDELDALLGLLCHAHKGNRADLYGTDLVHIDKVVLRRLRKLARHCQNQHTTVFMEEFIEDNKPDGAV